MFKLVVAGFVAAFAYARHPVSSDMIETIKHNTDLWTPYEAYENPFANYSMEELKALLGTVVAAPSGFPEPEVNLNTPTSFDSRT